MDQASMRQHSDAATEHATSNASDWLGATDPNDPHPTSGASERRVAADGEAYTYNDFEEHYGATQAYWKWNQCKAIGENREDVATERAGFSTGDSTENAEQTTSTNYGTISNASSSWITPADAQRHPGNPSVAYMNASAVATERSNSPMQG